MGRPRAPLHTLVKPSASSEGKIVKSGVNTPYTHPENTRGS
ncbi:hypothetical protein DKAM_0291 [Desulfurococcus amylolyticus 1221n]|uniref:Uncharacterized protein n=1 Tax=Desulfurococcus amylolyticus (strain DSM 18924 / JCM 16383 / VKM B-2413 / 1221n) TaxID=490899 RepID=B8D2M9_DESA1|nr:hypothetical protein DKAM_0291 [Desulfurococcus amylolyticus 1221n]